MSDTKLYNLFSFPKLCNSCIEKYQPNIQLEVIPFLGGLIKYYYLYSDLNLSIVQKEYLLPNIKMLLNPEIFQGSNLILLMDEQNKKEIMNSLDFLKPFQKVTILSLMRINVDDFMSFL